MLQRRVLRSSIELKSLNSQYLPFHIIMTNDKTARHQRGLCFYETLAWPGIMKTHIRLPLDVGVANRQDTVFLSLETGNFIDVREHAPEQALARARTRNRHRISDAGPNSIKSSFDAR